ncbi:MAG: CvpA family protein [Thermoanaerobaculales bacterium]|nr:CvpA family protein [Thermoanaerobaculales bacterium]
MTVLDWVLVVLWGGIALSGFWKGAVRIVFGIGGVVVGLWLALAVGGDLAIIFSESLSPAWLAAAAGRLAPVLAALLLFTLAGWGIERTLKAMHLGFLNRFLGAALAGVVGGVLLGLLLVLSLGVSPEWAALCRDSFLFPYLVDLAELVFGAIAR